MVEKFSKSWELALALLVTLFVPYNRVEANEVYIDTNHPPTVSLVEQYEQQQNSLNNITPVAELSDIQPTDWAYTTLQALLDRHPLTAKINLNGEHPLTRYEFAVVLNSTINNLENHQIVETELQVLQQLQREFAGELSKITKKLDNVERRLETQSTQQFSTTTKFRGEALLGLSAIEAGDNAGGNSSTTFGSRVRLNFDTRFWSKDRLRIRFQAANLPRLDKVTDTDMARLSYQGGAENALQVSRLEYSFPIGEQLKVNIPVVGGSVRDFTNILNPHLSGSSRGSISRFGQRNPIYRHGQGSGLGISYEISDAVQFDVGFIANNVNQPDTGFNKAEYGAIAQLTLEPADDVQFGFTYVRSYNSIDTGTGSERANDPFDDKSEAIAADSFGFQSSVKMNKDFTLGGWVGYTRAIAVDLPNNPSASIFNWAFTLAFTDLGSEGNLAGFVIGQPPKVTSNDFQVTGNKYSDPNTSLHLEAFYRMKVLEDVTVTFGLLMITNPEHNTNNDNIYIGTMRTVFRF
jgi:Carbohydrate-selective porin, OprB family